MFDMFKRIFELMQQGAASPDTDMVANQLAQLGDPEAVMAPLFQDTKQWSPTYMGEGMTPPQAPLLAPGSLAAEGPMITFDKMLQAPGKPQIDLGNSRQFMDGTARPPMSADLLQPPKQQEPGLTALQMKELMGQMPGSEKGYVPPAPPLGRVTPFNSQMAQLQAGPVTAAKRPTLADLIYGAR